MIPHVLDKGHPFGVFQGPTYAICRHYQFSDKYNGVWYLEIISGRTLDEFILREIRNKEVVRQQAWKGPRAFQQARKVYWDRSFKMSQEAGLDSTPPLLPEIDWGPNVR